MLSYFLTWFYTEANNEMNEPNKSESNVNNNLESNEKEDIKINDNEYTILDIKCDLKPALARNLPIKTIDLSNVKLKTMPVCLIPLSRDELNKAIIKLRKTNWPDRPTNFNSDFTKDLMNECHKRGLIY